MDFRQKKYHRLSLALSNIFKLDSKKQFEICQSNYYKLQFHLASSALQRLCKWHFGELVMDLKLMQNLSLFRTSYLDHDNLDCTNFNFIMRDCMGYRMPVRQIRRRGFRGGSGLRFFEVEVLDYSRLLSNLFQTRWRYVFTG